MREILFRGRRADKRWIEGYLVKNNEKYYIYYEMPDEMCQTGNWLLNDMVYPETVGQYTGLTDKNGTKIFEGDIVKYSNGYGHIAWAELHGAFMCVEENGEYWEWISNTYDIEVVGNIHDNAELLESGVDSE